MKLSVPLNWDEKLVDSLCDGKYPINDFYGNLPEDLIGGGRSSVLFSAGNSKKMVSRLVKKIHDAGFKFAYLMSSPCLDNLEYTQGFQKKIND